MFSTCIACGSETTEHPQVHLDSAIASACVDSGLADLLNLIWSLDIYTLGCCEDHLWSGRCMIEFDEVADAETFLAIALAKAPADLRLRVLEAADPPDTEADEWGFQVSLRWLAEPGQLPLLRFSPIVTFPRTDTALVVSAFAAGGVIAQEQVDPVDLIIAATRGSVHAYCELSAADAEEVERAMLETDWSRLLIAGSDLDVLTNRPADASAMAWLVTLCTATAANRNYDTWDFATLDEYAAPLKELMGWLELAADYWDGLLPLDVGAADPLDRSIEIDGDPRPRDVLSRASHELLSAMHARDLEWTGRALAELRRDALSYRDTVSHLVKLGWYPKGDPRSRTQKDLERNRIEVELTTDPRVRLRKRALDPIWPLAVKIQPIAGEQLLLAAEGTGEVREISYQGNQRELVELARELLKLPFAAPMACRVIRDGPSRPLEVSFLPIDGEWEEVEAENVQRGDILDRSVEYPAVVSDLHAGDHAQEIQLELNGMGWWTINRSESLRRLLPRDLSSGVDERLDEA